MIDGAACEVRDSFAALDLDRQLSECLGLGVADSGVLERAGIRTVRQLVAQSESQLLRIKQFGRTRLRRVKAALAEKGLSLATFASPATSARQALVEAHHKRIEESARAVNKSEADRRKIADPISVAVLAETVRIFRRDALRVAGWLLVEARELDDLADAVEPTAVGRDVRAVARRLRELATSGEIAGGARP